MKSKLTLIFLGLAMVFLSSVGYSQESMQENNQKDTTEKKQEENSSKISKEESPIVETTSFHQEIKKKFIEGGAGFMGIILVCLILGLAFCIERILYLNLSSINTRKFISDIESTLKKDGIEQAKDLCRKTRGPIASIYYQGIDRIDEGLEAVEKAVISYGDVQMGLLEKNISWISLFIALAPMLGFMGTVIGMIEAFDAIEAKGDISPSLVAGGIKVALLTTVFGLIVAMILQVFYNYIISKIDNLVNKMTDASVSLIDILVRYKK